MSRDEIRSPGTMIIIGLALVVRINETYGTIEEDEIHKQDNDNQ